MVFWAKTGTDGEYLPLGRHLEDTAAVAARLWDAALTDAQRSWFARELGISVPAARSWAVFFAGVHDVGKASPRFQELVPDLAARLLDPRLSRPATEAIRHDAVSGAILAAWLIAAGVPRRVAERLVSVVSGHHGVPRPRDDVRRATHRTLARIPDWRPHQQAQLDAIATRLELAPTGAPGGATDEAILALAGLVSVADWIASDARRFPVTAGPRPGSHELAQAALDVSAWAPPMTAPPADFAAVFGRPPRPTQAAVAQLAAIDQGPRSRLVLIEDRTGSGKTEAALYVALDAVARGARGLYVGLPTRATAAQLHARVAAFVESIWPEARGRTRLLHGGVHVDAGDPSPTGVAREDGLESDADADQWFAQSRRGLLAPMAVGTIDQALLAVLNAKHYPVRLWGLQGKVVIVDEVHAYDMYTGLLVARLVTWLAALDCTVVLLSATLPPSRRRELVRAFARGNGATTAVDGPAPEARYPRITVCASDRVATHAVADDRPGRAIALEWDARVNDAAGVAARALEEARSGGCVAVVCSTVALAQERYRRLRANAGDATVVLLHARMRPLERAPLERTLLERLGPASRPEHRSNLIVVATQIVEQSLDLDFDVMLTDLAPVDLLVQRAGRVHRHTRPQRPGGHEQPCLIVLDTPGLDATRDLPAGAGAVYVHATLARTRLALRGRAVISEPADLDELIWAVYEPAVPTCATELERAAVAALDERAANDARELGGWALAAAVASPGGDDPPWDVHGAALMDPDDPRAQGRNSAATRWSEDPTASFVLLEQGELAGRCTRPNREDAVELLKRAVGISAPQVVRPALRALEALRPVHWRRSGRLRHQLLVRLDEERRPVPVACDDGSGELVLPLRFDPDEGVVVLRSGEDVQPR